MSKEIYISSTPHETRLAIVEKDELTEIYYERENEYTLAGSIYNGRVTRVLPGMQSSFVDIGLERDAFLYITDFMEEAGDNAEFEGTDASRAPRTERPRSDAPRGDNARTEGSREGGGRDRDRGRGRRDGRRRDAQTPIANTGYADTEPVEPRNFAPVDEDPTEFAPRATEGDEIGEGAPGADGSRRWRGRRGRRRGRGDASPEATTAASEPLDTTPEAAPRDREPRSSEPRSERGPREGRDRGGRDRGPREGRDSRHDAVRERFAPRTSFGGARPGDDELVDLNASAAPAIEPFILPGESLSKYRPGGETHASETPRPTTGILVTAKPSSEVEVPALTGWDGGAVLPGETIRRREPAAEIRSSQPRANFESRDDRGGERGRDRRRDRDRGRNRETFSPEPSATLHPAEAVQPAVTSAHDTHEREYEPSFPATYDTLPDPVVEHAFETTYESQTDALPADHELISPAAEALIEELHEAVAEFHETTTDYEPGEDASASFRVDPAPPSEFRQSAPVEDDIFVPLEDHSFVEETHTEAPPRPAITHLEPTGEMISELPASVASEPSPAAPIEHEAAVQSVTLHEAEATSTPFHPLEDRALEGHAPEAGKLDDQRFAPGDGEIEEEFLDDDDTELGSLHASAFDDDTEEETLENAADLGSMIRDMSIDDITRSEPVELDEDEEADDADFDEEDDFEEDELESNGEEVDADEELSGSDISDSEEEQFAEASYDEEGNEIQRAPRSATAAPREGHREGGRRGRRDGRRGGRDRDRAPRDTDRTHERGNAEGAPATERSSSSDRSSGERGSRDRRGMAGSRSGGGDRRGYGGGSRNTQAANLPAISDLLKPGQEVLVQIAKEPIAKKGARITSHIALPGRFLVFMPTVSHTGVSRKIESDAERRRLKEILLSERGDASGGFIVRTAAAGASEEELRSDLRFLLNLWADIKARSESSKSPALIYHDLNLIERILRDQVTDNFSAIWCDTEAEYERVLRFLQRFQPSLIRRVKLYTKDTPLFEQFGITEEINKALRSKVWLKSGGSIVINQTEALVAIDINTGKFVGKTTKLEDTIVKTNLDSIPEIVRQIRLRDLGGIIIIDFIDMDERKNRNKVMAALEDELKKDRAPSKVLQFNDFGLVAITRKRVKQSLERTLSTTCAVCQGTGMTKSAITVCNDIYIEMRKMHKLIEKGDIMLRVHPEVVKQLKSGGKWLQEMEEMSGKTILIKSDPSLHPEQFDIH
jgi:ribonuclease G